MMLIAISLLSLSFAPILVKWSQTPAEVIGFWRLMVAFLVMQAFGRSSKTAEKLSRFHWLLALVSGAFFFCHLWTYFLAVQHTKVANCTILYSLNPIFTAILSVLFFREKFEKHWWLSLALAFTSIVLLFSDQAQFAFGNAGMFQTASLSNPDFAGNILALISAIFFSGYLSFGNLARKKLSNSQFTSAAYLTAAICFLVVVASKETPLTDYPPRTWIGISLLIIFPTLLGHAVFTHLLSRLNVNFLSCLKLTEPVMTSLWAVFLFNESVSRYLALALGLCVSSLLILLAPLGSRSK